MIERLLERAATRLVFVVGKGGVGKSTTASALALALADRSFATHLISSDPAHSLGDVYHQDLADGLPHTAHCSDLLTLEEFAARRYAEHFFAELRAPLIDLIERGTYLDTTDAASFLDLSIPGIDEVMAALRLVELHASAAQRVVVDTAPTGHTLRLLEASNTILSWVTAGRAMAEKAGTVAAHLVGRRVPTAAEPLLDRLELQAKQFDDTVLRESSAIVVTHSGEVVAAETKMLLERLAQHRIAVAATVATGTAPDADFTAPMLVAASGCDGLRDWAKQLQLHVTAETAAIAARTHAPGERKAERWLQSLEQKLLLVAGKGGVGKSTCAAAIAATLSRQRRACIVSTDPAGSLSQLFTQDVRNEVVAIAPNLFARQIDAPREFQRMQEQYRERVTEVLGSFGLDTALRLDRNVIDSLWDLAPPGIDELIALIEILEAADAYDVLVIDSAPTGHFLRLIELPAIALDWVHALMRILVKYSALGSLDALARDLLAFARNLRHLQSDLITPERAAAFVVTLDQPVVAAETARLNSAVARSGLHPAALIVNRTSDGSRLHHDVPMIVAPEMPGEIVGIAALHDFVAHWELRSE